MTDQEKCMAGICCICGGPTAPMTTTEIEEIKGDLGIPKEDDFGNICDDCCAESPLCQGMFSHANSH